MIYLNSVVDYTHQEASEFICFIQLPEKSLNPCFEQVVVVLLLGLYGMSKNLSLNKIIFWNRSHLDLFMAIILQFHRVVKGYIEKRVKKDNDFEISPFSIL